MPAGLRSNAINPGLVVIARDIGELPSIFLGGA